MTMKIFQCIFVEEKTRSKYLVSNSMKLHSADENKKY